MVSLRRRRLLGFCTGVDNSILTTLPTIDMNENAPEDATIRSSNGVHPMPLYDLNIRAEEEDDGLIEMDPSSRMCGSNGTHDQNNQPNSFGSALSTEVDCQPHLELKPKKQQRRRKNNNQEPNGSPRGVYFKNKKWQAAIKVDKKQIHLGTVDSEKEAAHLYDRAAYMCGRQPNFELSEEEKQELRKLEWDEFMDMTRSAISSKRSKRGRVIGKVQPSLQNSDWEGEQGAENSSVSDDIDLETSTF